MEGILFIETLDIVSPILRGATKRNLDIATCVLTRSPQIGEIGNYILAGHASRIYNRHFNRLHQLKIGDTVVVSNGKNLYSYTVFEIHQVKPKEVWVLEDTPDHYTLTLITCDYTVKPTGRLVIRCAAEAKNG